MIVIVAATVYIVPTHNQRLGCCFLDNLVVRSSKTVTVRGELVEPFFFS
jgi:hypothetical protein